MGKFLDRDYKAIRDQMLLTATSDPEKPAEDVVSGENFPIEKARLRTVPIYIAIFTACCIGYGWCLQAKVSLAGPLILQFLSKLQLPFNLSILTIQNSWIRDDFYHEYHSDLDGGYSPITRLFSNCLCTWSCLTEERIII